LNLIDDFHIDLYGNDRRVTMVVCGVSTR